MHSLKSSGTDVISDIVVILSLHSFAPRNRDIALNLQLRVALAKPEAEEIEEDLEDRDESETIDSGDEAVETELASEDRRNGQKF